jgi:hypothetical protein
MCKHYKKYTCSNRNCKFAHEGDGYTVLVPNRKIKSLKGEKKRAIAHNKVEKQGLEGLRSGCDGLYDDFLERKEGNGDEGDMSAALPLHQIVPARRSIRF